jgi:hypothetical protein
MSASPALPKGISQLASGSYQVRVAETKGSKSTVTLTFKTSHEAMTAWQFGNHAKETGECVRSAMCAAKRETSAPATTPTAVIRNRTVSELLDELLAERQRVVDLGDPSFRRSIAKGRNTFRPTSMKSLRIIVENHLRPTFGHLKAHEVNREVVNTWIVGLAEQTSVRKAIDTGRANQLLIWLRAVIGRADRSEQPQDFPWKGVAPVPPKNPMKKRSDPSKWGGDKGDADPVLPMGDLVLLANDMKPADRIVLYSEHLGGPRIGELFGLSLSDLYFDPAGTLWAYIHRQMLCSGEVVDWVKTDAAYRRIPLAGILSDYIVEYCRAYHDYDLHLPDPTKSHRTVVVNPSGRDYDGSFLPGRRGGWTSREITARAKSGLTHENIGYHLDAHHQRKTCATILLVGKEVIASINAETDDEMKSMTDLEAQVEYWRDRAETNDRLELGYSPMHVSAYLGHEHTGRREELPASTVTMRYYNISVRTAGPFIAIANIMDRIARHELGEIHHVADEYDKLPVQDPKDPGWISVLAAVKLMGIQVSNVIENIHAGRIDGHMVWLADGGWRRNTPASRVPAVPQFVVSVESVQRYVDYKNRLSLKAAGARLGMVGNTFRQNFVDTGCLPLLDGGLDPGGVEALVATIHDALLGSIAAAGTVTQEALWELVQPALSEIFQRRQVKRAWLKHWVDELVETGNLKRRGEMIMPA